MNISRGIISPDPQPARVGGSYSSKDLPVNGVSQVTRSRRLWRNPFPYRANLIKIVYLVKFRVGRKRPGLLLVHVLGIGWRQLELIEFDISSFHNPEDLMVFQARR